MKVNPWITRVGLLLILLVVAGFCWASPQNASASPVQQAGSPLPTPRVSIYFYPTLPSTADYVSFYANVDDPLGWWGYTYMWVFGDGSSSADVYGYASHQYAAEGKYTVSLTVTSSDGRIGTVAVTFVVENHDVWISKVTTPSQASAGQVKQISVAVNSKKFDETVWVNLERGINAPYTGWEPIGTSRQLVLVKDKGKGTLFTFNYRFTAADAAAGKVSFRATASIDNRTDVSVSDNEYISIATTVKGGKLRTASIDGAEQVEDAAGADDAESIRPMLYLPAIAGN